MRVLICGSRNWTDRQKIRNLIRELPYHAVVIHGGHWEGADKIADEEAKAAGLRVESYPVIHDLDGPWPQAGPKRNTRMVKMSMPEFCFAFRSPGKSKGTDDCVRKARASGAHTHVVREKEDPIPKLRESFHQLTVMEYLAEAMGKPETTDNGDGTYTHTWTAKEEA